MVDKSPASKHSLFTLCFIFLASFLMYANTLGHGFVWDDFAHFVNTDAMRRWDNFPKFFTTPYWILLTGGYVPYHRPLVPVLTLLISSFSGIHPLGYHLTSVFFQSLISVFFYLYLKSFVQNRWILFSAVTAFMVHPIHVEAAAWATASLVLLCVLFFLLTLIASRNLQGENSRADIRMLSAGCLFLTLGIMTYHLIIIVPAIAILHHWLFPVSPISQNSKKMRTIEITSYVLIIAGFMVYSYLVLRRFAPADFAPSYHPETTNIIYLNTSFEKWITPLNVGSRYLENLLFPFSLSPDYYFKAPDLSFTACLSFLFFVLISFWMYRSIPEERKLLIFSWLWMIVSLAPFSGIIRTGGLFADRYAYLCSMGYSLWLGILAFGLQKSFSSRGSWGKTIAVGIFGVVLFGYGLKTIQQNQIWKNEIRFWYEASLVTPGKARIHNKLGIALEAQGNLTEAAKAYEEVLRLSPVYFVMAHKNLARVLKKMGRLNEAQDWEEKGRQITDKMTALTAAGGLKTQTSGLKTEDLDRLLGKKA